VTICLLAFKLNIVFRATNSLVIFLFLIKKMVVPYVHTYGGKLSFVLGVVNLQKLGR